MLLFSLLLAGTIIKLIMTSSSIPVPAGLLAWYSRQADYLSNDKSNFHRVARVAYLGTRNKSRRQADKPIAFRHSDSDLIVLNALSVLRSPCWAGGLRWAQHSARICCLVKLCHASLSDYVVMFTLEKLTSAVINGFLSVQKKNKYHVKF